MAKTLKKMVLVGTLIILAIVGCAALQVDDWSRDLSTNHAATTNEAGDPLLRPLTTTASAKEISVAIQKFVEDHPRWALESQDTDPLIELTYTTKLFRFVDDVKVSWQPTAAGTKVHITSQSRVGKGDLGQNPRNIRQLMKFLRSNLSSVE